MKIVHLKKMFTVTLILSIFLLINQNVTSEEIDKSIIYVSNSELGNFSTIQEGIDAAVSGDTVYVYIGTYFENIVIDKSITLIGEDKNNTIIDGRSAGNTVKVNADHVTLKGFTIQHSGQIYPNSGINLSSDNNLIENNIITTNLYGMTLYFSSDNTIKSNYIKNNTNCGIYLSKSSSNLIINNTIHNQFFNGIGLYYSSDKNTIQSNNLNKNGFCGVNIRTSQDNNVIDNNFTDNNIGIHLPQSSNTASNNTFSNNKIDIEREFALSEPESLLIFAFVVIVGLIGIILYRNIIKKKK